MTTTIIVLPFSQTLKMTLLSLGPIHNLIPTILSSMMNGLLDKANRRMVEVVNFRKKYFTLLLFTLVILPACPYLMFHPSYKMCSNEKSSAANLV
jgi:hypothetical protein